MSLMTMTVTMNVLCILFLVPKVHLSLHFTRKIGLKVLQLSCIYACMR